MNKAQNPNALRYINRKTNKVREYSKHLANDPRWKKMTGFEPQPLSADPVEAPTVNPPINIEDEVQKRVAAELAKHNLTGDIGASVEVKPKRKYTKKKV